MADEAFLWSCVAAWARARLWWLQATASIICIGCYSQMFVIAMPMAVAPLMIGWS